MNFHLAGLEDVRTSGDVPTDVRLVTSDGIVNAHSLICCTISPVLRAALRSTSGFKESESRTVNLDYASSDAIKKMFSFACGSSATSIGANDAMDLLPISDELGFLSLRSYCETTLASVLTSDNASDILAVASAHGRMELAAKARHIVDRPDSSSTLRGLMDEKNELTATKNALETKIAELEAELQRVEKVINNTSDQIDYEMDKTFKAISLTHAKIDDGAVSGGPPPYPHAVGRSLIALPPVTGWDDFVSKEGRRKLERKYGFGKNELVFNALSNAVEAALPGDVIELPRGKHYLNKDQATITKSLRIVGVEDDARIMIGGSKAFCAANGADILVSNITFHVFSLDGGLWVKDRARIWVDSCVVQPGEYKSSDGQLLCVEGVSSAFISHSVFKGGVASAISVDPQAEHVFVSDSVIGGCGLGGTDKNPFYAPGECGAIEVWFDCIREGDRKSHSATVKITLLRNTITNCFGPALSYRDSFTLLSGVDLGGKRKSFKWPGQSVVKMQDNKINGNGLARPQGSVPDGEVMFRNTHSDGLERDGDFDDSDY